MNSRSPLGAGRIVAMLARKVRIARLPALGSLLACALVVYLAGLVFGTARAEVVAPVLESWEQIDPSNLGQAVPARNGDTVRIATHWNQDSLTVSANCGEISDGPVSVIHTGLREYLIVHTIPLENARPDGNARILITAVRDTFRTVENSPGVCLSNHPPSIDRVLLVDPPASAYTRGDTIQIASKWQSWDSLLFVTADFRAIQPSYTIDRAQDVIVSGANFGDSLDTRYHLISFVVPFPLVSPDSPDGHGPDGLGLVIPLTAIDRGCGLTQDATIQVNLDTTPPDSLPQVDPLPLETTADSVHVEGTAPGAVRVSVWRNDGFQFRSPVDLVTRRFAFTLKLSDDRQNKIYVKSEDLPGNPTVQSNIQFVTQVRSPGFAIPRPYRRSQSIVFRRLEGARELELRLFDLEGACLRVWQAETTAREYRFDWDGTDAQGNRAGQGMYVLRATWRELDGGGSRSESAGLFLRD